MEEGGMSGFCMRGRGNNSGNGSGYQYHHHHHHQYNRNNSISESISNNISNSNVNGGGGSKCGRWNPTTEQVKLLTELFRSGLRTPSTDQIQKISSQLSFYGKIESKNVFYWFQNHKARERQKRRKLSSFDHNIDHLHDHHLNLTNNPPPPKSTQENEHENVSMMNQVSETERVIETLQLFPLNSFCESETEKVRVHGNCRDNTTMFSYTHHHHHQGDQMEHPPLDLRLSFL